MASRYRENKAEKIGRMTREYSGKLDRSAQYLSIILAGGFGKRIKSERPKVLHEVWGEPSVKRVADAAQKGLKSPNQIIVVGIGAMEVMEVIGKQPHTLFAYQREQKGTGHALQVALESVGKRGFNGVVVVFPADMCLIERGTVRRFIRAFEKADLDMMVLTGQYEGDTALNRYGRIVRVPKADANGDPSGELENDVIEIIEHKDILKLENGAAHETTYRGRPYVFTRQELLENREFNSGVYAFRGPDLMKHLYRITSDNAQREIYVTDLVSIFNRAKLRVGAHQLKDNTPIVAFNDKSTLKHMQALAQKMRYDQLKDIISIEDEDQFFLADDVVRDLLRMERKGKPLDIVIGPGAHVSKGVKLNRGVEIARNAILDGNIILGEGVKIHEGANVSTYPEQTLVLGDGTEILQGDIVKGNTHIGKNCRIESSVNITGSDEFPTRIGDKVTIKGTSYVFGSIIEKNCWIEHSVIIRMYVDCVKAKDGTIRKIKYYLPPPEGNDSLRPIEK
ncbi:MAG: NTP transferase domain-containing protein [Planctomycetes bacterium]|nr:NTP transferase domain-containing protein [Planctomycetota bacterium]